jgi:hypothetical protein
MDPRSSDITKMKEKVAATEEPTKAAARRAAAAAAETAARLERLKSKH